MGNRSGKGIRPNVKEMIETGYEYMILEVLEAHFAQKVRLTDEEIRAAVKKIIEKGNESRIYEYMILELLRAHFAQKVRLTDEEIRATVKKIIEKGNESRIFELLEAHFAQKVRLTDEEIGVTVRKLLCNYVSYCKYSEYNQYEEAFLKNYFSKLTRVQIVIFAKEAAPNKMTAFLWHYSRKLDSDRFQWIVEASPPRFIWLFWKKCPTTLSQEKRIIVSINVQRQKLIAILKAVSKHLSCFTLIQYLKAAPWQDLRYLLPESDG
jgi:hypothetical protein